MTERTLHLTDDLHAYLDSEAVDRILEKYE